jgi:hypothetical protein
MVSKYHPDVSGSLRHLGHFHAWYGNNAPKRNFTEEHACFSESFETLITGFQMAVSEPGRVPHRHRTDNLSAATHDLRDGRAFFLSEEVSARF